MTSGWIYCMRLCLCLFHGFHGDWNSICLLRVIWHGHYGNDLWFTTGTLTVLWFLHSAYPLALKNTNINFIILQFQVARGSGSILGPILVGKIFDHTGSYAFGNIAGCICLSCSVVCMIVVMLLHSRQVAKSPLL